MDGSMDDKVEKEIFSQFPDKVLSFSWARLDDKLSTCELGSLAEEKGTGDAQAGSKPLDSAALVPMLK